MSFTIADVRHQLEQLGFHDVSDEVVESFVKKLLIQQQQEQQHARAAHDAYVESEEEEEEQPVSRSFHHGVHVLSPVAEESPSALAPRPHAHAHDSSDESEHESTLDVHQSDHDVEQDSEASDDENDDVVEHQYESDGESQGTDIDIRGSFDAMPWMQQALQQERVTANSFFHERLSQTTTDASPAKASKPVATSTSPAPMVNTSTVSPQHKRPSPTVVRHKMAQPPVRVAAPATNVLRERSLNVPHKSSRLVAAVKTTQAPPVAKQSAVHAWHGSDVSDAENDAINLINDDDDDEEEDSELDDAQELAEFFPTRKAPAATKSVRPSSAPMKKSVIKPAERPKSASRPLPSWNSSTVIDAPAETTEETAKIVRPQTAPGTRLSLPVSGSSAALPSSRPSTARPASASYLTRPMSARNLVANTNVRKTDRVSRMQQYQSAWKSDAFLTRKPANDAAVAQIKAFMRQKPAALKKTAPQSRVPAPNALAAPTTKKRHEVRWQIRAQFLAPHEKVTH